MATPESAYKKTGMIDTIRKRTSESFEGAKDVLKDNVSREKFNNVKSSWKEDVADALQRRDIDKYSRKETGIQNKLVNKKNGEIRGAQKDIDNFNKLVAKKESALIKEKSKIDSVLDSGKITDPGIKKLFEDQKVQKEEKWNKEKESDKERLGKLIGKKSELEKSVDTFKSNIDDIKKGALGKINTKIDDIRKKEKYQDKIDDSKKLGTEIKDYKKSVETSRDLFGQCKEALKNKKLLSSEQQISLTKLYYKTQEEIRLAEDKLKEAEKKKSVLDRQIGKIDRKTAKWEKLKGKYDLTPKESAQARSGSGSFEIRRGGGVAPENLEEIDYTAGIEKNEEEKKLENKVENKQEEKKDEDLEFYSEDEKNIENLKQKLKLLGDVDFVCKYQKDENWNNQITSLSDINYVEGKFKEMKKLDKESGLADTVLKMMSKDYMNINNPEEIAQIMDAIWVMTRKEMKKLESSTNKI